MNDRCFFFITDKREFIKEAVRCIESIKRHMPDIPAFIFTPLDYEDWHIIRVHDKGGDQWFIKQTAYMVEAMEIMFAHKKVIYLDCDTYLCAPVYELFDMLDRYEIMGAHAPGRYTTNTEKPIPASFPELNIGVNPMRNSKSMQDFWRSVLWQYNRNMAVYGNNDQGSLRESLWNDGGGMRLYILPPEYNLRFNFPCFISREAKILHGHADNIEEIAQKINADKGMRVWYQNQLFTQ